MLVAVRVQVWRRALVSRSTQTDVPNLRFRPDGPRGHWPEAAFEEFTQRRDPSKTSISEIQICVWMEVGKRAKHFQRNTTDTHRCQIYSRLLLSLVGYAHQFRRRRILLNAYRFFFRQSIASVMRRTL